MELTFLGTGSSLGVPQPACTCEVCLSNYYKDTRLRSCVWIKHDHSNIIIDSGPDFRAQVLKHGIRHLDALLLTHAHRDHIAGLDDVRGFNYVNHKDMQVYTSLATEKELKHIFHYIFSKDKHPMLPNININIIDKNSVFYINDIKISTIEVRHDKMKVLGFRINDLAYITDINGIDDSEVAKLQDLDILILNALQQDKHISQFNLSEAINFSKSLGPKKTFFTHIGHKMGLHKQVEKNLSDGMFLAYDGLALSF